MSLDLGLFKAYLRKYGMTMFERRLIGLLPSATVYGGSFANVRTCLLLNLGDAGFRRYATDSMRSLLDTMVDIYNAAAAGNCYKDETVFESSPFFHDVADHMQWHFHFVQDGEAEDQKGKEGMLVVLARLEELQVAETELDPEWLNCFNVMPWLLPQEARKRAERLSEVSYEQAMAKAGAMVPIAEPAAAPPAHHDIDNAALVLADVLNAAAEANDQGKKRGVPAAGNARRSRAKGNK